MRDARKLSGVFFLPLCLVGCMTGQMGPTEVSTPQPESYWEDLFDGEAVDGLNFPDAVWKKGVTVWAADDEQLFQLWVDEKGYGVEPVGPLPKGKTVVGVEVDPADPQQVYVLVKESEDGQYRILRGTGRNEWESFASFRTPVPTEAGAHAKRLPLRGLSATNEALVFREEFIEGQVNGDPTWVRSHLESFSLSLQSPELAPVKRFSHKGKAREVLDAPTSEFPTQDLACAQAFHRRAFALNQMSEERDCPTHPLSVGGRDFARASLISVLSKAQAVTALPDSPALLVASDDALSVVDVWLHEKSGKAYVRTDRHVLPLVARVEGEKPRKFKHLAGFGAAGKACEWPASEPLWSQMTQLLTHDPELARSQMTQLLMQTASNAKGVRCRCALLTQVAEWMTRQDAAKEAKSAMSQVVAEEASRRGCVLPGEAGKGS